MSQRLACKLQQTEQRLDGSSLFVYVMDEYIIKGQCPVYVWHIKDLFKPTEEDTLDYLPILWAVHKLSRFLSFDLSLMC